MSNSNECDFGLELRRAPPVRRAAAILNRLRHDLRDLAAPVRKVNEAAKEVEEITQQDDSETAQTEVSLEGPSLSERLFDGTQDTLIMGGMTAVLLYFLLVSGDFFLGKTLQFVPACGARRRLLLITREIQIQISHCLISTSLINAGLGVTVAAAFYLLGLRNPLLWGIPGAQALNRSKPGKPGMPLGLVGADRESRQPDAHFL